MTTKLYPYQAIKGSIDDRYAHDQQCIRWLINNASKRCNSDNPNEIIGVLATQLLRLSRGEYNTEIVWKIED